MKLPVFLVVFFYEGREVDALLDEALQTGGFTHDEDVFESTHLIIKYRN